MDDSGHARGSELVSGEGVGVLSKTRKTDGLLAKLKTSLKSDLFRKNHTHTG